MRLRRTLRRLLRLPAPVPHWDPALADGVCDGILEAKPFVYPAELVDTAG